MQTRIETLKQARKKVLVTLDEVEKATGEVKALKKLAESVNLPGFRPGKAPIDLVKEKAGKERILEETVRALLPDIMKAALAAGEFKPILQPSISVDSVEPLIVGVLFVERPEIHVKAAKKIGLKKEPMTEPTDADVESFIKNLLDRDRTEKSVDRVSKAGDIVEVSMEAVDGEGQQIKEISVGRYLFTIGKEELLPELEPTIAGTKAGDIKVSEVTFSKDHGIPLLQGKKAKVTMTVKEVRETMLPELTPEYIKKRLGVEKSVDAFKGDVRSMLAEQKKRGEMQKREQELLKLVREATTIDLAPELLNAEAQVVFHDFEDRIKSQGLTFADWIKSTGKEQKQVEEELMQAAKDRLTLRFGMHEVVKEREITVTDEEVNALIHQGMHGEHDHSEHAPGTPMFEDAKTEVKIRKFIDEMVGD